MRKDFIDFINKQQNFFYFKFVVGQKKLKYILILYQRHINAISMPYRCHNIHLKKSI